MTAYTRQIPRSALSDPKIIRVPASRLSPMLQQVPLASASNTCDYLSPLLGERLRDREAQTIVAVLLVCLLRQLA